MRHCILLASCFCIKVQPSFCNVSRELYLTNIISALLLLHSFYRATSTVIDKENAERSYREVTEITSKVTLPIARRLKEPTSADPHTPCPLLLDWIYRSAIAHHDVQQMENTNSPDSYVQTMLEAMEEVGHNWGVGGMVLSPLLTGVFPACLSTPIDYLHSQSSISTCSKRGVRLA